MRAARYRLPHVDSAIGDLALCPDDDLHDRGLSQGRESLDRPAYYLYNTARELTDMQVDNRFGQKGSGPTSDIKSPYPFKTSPGALRRLAEEGQRRH